MKCYFLSILPESGAVNLLTVISGKLAGISRVIDAATKTTKKIINRKSTK